MTVVFCYHSKVRKCENSIHQPPVVVSPLTTTSQCDTTTNPALLFIQLYDNTCHFACNTMSEVVRTSVSNARFSVFSDEEKKNALSVCHITSVETLDVEGRAIPSGLYDLSMGPTEQRIHCHTCHMNYINCPGHPGHIELDVPVYYPLYFNDLIRLLRTKCVYCHK
jgi:hypothetical protein